MISLILPALIALLLKFAVIFLVDAKKQSMIFMALFVTLALINLCEILAYLNYFTDKPAIMLMRSYYLLWIVALYYLILYTLEVAEIKASYVWRVALASILLILCVLIIFSDLIITGTSPTSYSLTATRGLYNEWIRAIGIVGLLFIPYILILRTFREKNPLIKTRCIYTLLALLPVLLTSMSVNILQLLDIEFSAALVTPVATTCFLFLVCYFEPKTKLTNILMYLPGSRERLLTKQLFGLASEFALDGKRIGDTKVDIERMLLLYALQKNNHVITRTAESLGMNRTTLYTAMKRCGIKHRY